MTNRPGEFVAAVAAQMRAERAAAGLSQRDMWEGSGLARSTYIRLETGERDAGVDQLFRVCEVLGLSPAEFLARAEERMRVAERAANIEALRGPDPSGLDLAAETEERRDEE